MIDQELTLEPAPSDAERTSNGCEEDRLPFVDGVYRTPPRKVSRLAAMFPSLTFHPQLAAAVFRASAKAKRGEYGSSDWCKTSRRVMQALENVGVRFEITGIEHLVAADSPCLIVGNHMGTLETAILPTILQPFRHVTFVVKRSLVDYPVFKYIMRSRDPIALSQTDARADFKEMLSEGPRRLERGVSIVVFPEGRRTPTFDPQNFNTLGVKLAHRAGVPIVPLALKTDAWALGHWHLQDFGRIDPSRPVHFAFGKPLRVQGRGLEENRQIIEFIQTKLAEWNRESG